MDVRFTPKNLSALTQVTTDALVVLWPEVLRPATLSTVPHPLSEWVGNLQDAKVLLPGVGKIAVAPGGGLAKARQLLVVGAGSGSVKDVRKAVLAAFGALKSAGIRSAHLCVELLPECGCPHIHAACQAAWEATYEFTHTKPTAKARSLKRLNMAHGALPEGARWVAQSEAMCAGIELAKEWANRPANHATPSMLANAALQLAQHRNTQVEVLGPKEAAKLGMGAFLAVAQGSNQSLRFIVIRYNGAAKESAPIVLIGKGITFDTGGISIKPAPEMDEMKFDMSGAASVLGAFDAIGRLQPRLNVVGLIPACENMPDGRAVKPGDVVTSMSGQTIEILNTDAEGRLVLCDALTYAERFKPDHIIDIATLTGACVIALGHVRSGLFSNSEKLSANLTHAGEQAQDGCWPMPLDEEYGEGLKSNFADMANVAGRPGGSISAAKFLEKFAGAHQWAHLDIAGTAWRSGAAKGGTGRPVGLLVQHLLNCALDQGDGGVSKKHKSKP